MAQAGWWARIGHWFRGSDPNTVNDLPAVGRDGFLHGLESEAARQTLGVISAPRLSKQQRREQTLDRLQDGHLRVVGLIESLQKHLEAQDRRGQSIAGSLEQVAENMVRLSEAARQQCETLGTIATQLQTGNDRAQRWEEAFAQFPALAEAQRATLATLGEQVAIGRQADERLGESLETVRGALVTLQDSASASTAVLRGVQASSTRSQELVGELIQKQRTWLAWLVVVTMAAALGALVLAVNALVRH